jgi:hypothetical protein
MKCSQALLLLSIFIAISGAAQASEEASFRQFSLRFIDAIRVGNFLPPPAAARALSIVHSCAYDAWTAFHETVRFLAVFCDAVSRFLRDFYFSFSSITLGYPQRLLLCFHESQIYKPSL